MPGISQTSGIFLVKDQARFRRWFAWLVTLCLFPHIINSKTKWKRCRNLHIVTKWKCSWSLGWVPVFCTDLGDNDPPLAPEQPGNTLSLGNMGRGLLPDPGIQSVYPIVWESHTSASLKRRWRAKSQILVTMEMYFPWGNITVSAVDLIVKLKRVTWVQTTGSAFKKKKWATIELQHPPWQLNVMSPPVTNQGKKSSKGIQRIYLGTE